MGGLLLGLVLAALLLGAGAWSVGETLTHRAASAADALGVLPPPGQTPGRCP